MSFADFAKAFASPKEAWQAWTTMDAGPHSGQPAISSHSTGYVGSFGSANQAAGGDYGMQAAGSDADAAASGAPAPAADR